MQPYENPPMKILFSLWSSNSFFSS